MYLVDSNYPDLRNVKKHYSDRDKNVSVVLERRDLKDDEKLTLYYQALNKFLINRRAVETELEEKPPEVRLAAPNEKSAEEKYLATASRRRTQKSRTHHGRRESLYVARLGRKRSIGASRTSRGRFEFTRNRESSFRNCREKEIKNFEKTDREGNVRRVSSGYNTDAHTRQMKQSKTAKTIRCGLGNVLKWKPILIFTNQVVTEASILCTE